MTLEEFAKGWRHFLECIDFNHSYLDSDAITFMNEMPAAVAKGLTRNRNLVRPTERKNPK